ncbi:hypothetical protein G7Y41_08815 [Schaalia sp. ZJ405]|uniref:hypothetical protein n=1 Tax=Schaalia sp. ZJ405 TaxID=2709403 RepID=UPI0013EC5406|nr:hypothetical protein [Schaalia sp. ZJ405]QPK81126.1 hypothetical protein G7Y41_08815 [Schaalia sp. ZJ405]
MAIIKKPATAGRQSKKIVRRTKKSDPTPDPLANVEYTDSLEEDAARELTALEEGYRERAANEKKRFIAATDSEYWFCVSFQDREEKERFLKAIGMTGRNAPDKYITGQQLADTLGISY